MCKKNKRKQNKDLLYDMEPEYTPADYYNESERRDVYYSAMVKDIVGNNRTSQKLKIAFFCVVCAAFLITCISGMIVVCIISCKRKISVSDISVAITGFGAVLSSIIVLPKIIANHLFPKNSEKVRFNFIRDIQKLDQGYMEDDVNDFQEAGENDEDDFDEDDFDEDDE